MTEDTERHVKEFTDYMTIGLAKMIKSLGDAITFSEEFLRDSDIDEVCLKTWEMIQLAFEAITDKLASIERLDQLKLSADFIRHNAGLRQKLTESSLYHHLLKQVDTPELKELVEKLEAHSH